MPINRKPGGCAKDASLYNFWYLPEPGVFSNFHREGSEGSSGLESEVRNRYLFPRVKEEMESLHKRGYVGFLKPSQILKKTACTNDAALFEVQT